MPRSGGDAAPRDYITHGTWPNGTLTPDAPASARYGQVFIQRLRAALNDKGNPSSRAVAREAHISRNSLDRALEGATLPDFGAIARLEEWLDVDLWPGPEIRRQTGPDGRREPLANA
ncbi:helix-turn-helix transcriptional regulator [Micrococcus luteus]|uniref:helix-turn-helix domain-containing protein n=1 Tax=Micrococcus luteus TaxID=1270 RepID=UPI003015BEA1